MTKFVLDKYGLDSKKSQAKAKIVNMFSLNVFMLAFLSSIILCGCGTQSYGGGSSSEPSSDTSSQTSEPSSDTSNQTSEPSSDTSSQTSEPSSDTSSQTSEPSSDTSSQTSEPSSEQPITTQPNYTSPEESNAQLEGEMRRLRNQEHADQMDRMHRDIMNSGGTSAYCSVNNNC